MKGKIIVATLEDYGKDLIEQCEKEGIISKESDRKMMRDYCKKLYYKDVCDALAGGAYIADYVYENIPDLHYWISKYFLIHGMNVIKSMEDMEKESYEVLEIKAS